MHLCAVIEFSVLVCSIYDLKNNRSMLLLYKIILTHINKISIYKYLANAITTWKKWLQFKIEFAIIDIILKKQQNNKLKHKAKQF